VIIRENEVAEVIYTTKDDEEALGLGWTIIFR
jgi:hypothetical protein